MLELPDGYSGGESELSSGLAGNGKVLGAAGTD
jgi:hypothetical protein